MMHPPVGRRAETRPPARDGDATARLEAGDSRTLGTLYDRHVGAIYSLAMRVTGEPADAEAIVRGVFAAAWSEAALHPGRRAPNAHWMLSTARIRAIDHVRGGSREAAPAAAGAAGNGPTEATAGARADDIATLHLPDPVLRRVTDGTLSEAALRLRAAFRGLPPLERLAIELAYFEGLTISQIAGRLEQAPDAANVRIRTGLRRLAGRAEAQRRSESRHDKPATRDLAGLYALGALNASERAAFDAHLEVHRESVDEVLALLPVTRLLAWVAPPHEPPAGLRNRVIETVTGAPLPHAVEEEDAPESSRAAAPASAPQPADADADADGISEPLDANAEPTDAGDNAAPEDSDGRLEPEGTDGGPSHAERSSEPVPAEGTAPRVPEQPAWELAPPALTPPVQEPPPPMQQSTPPVQKKGGRVGLLVLVVASLAIAGGLGWFAAQQSNLATALQENLDAANTQARIAELETAAAQRVADEFLAGTLVLTADDVQTLDLSGQPTAPDARGRLYWSASEGGLLSATGLPPVPPGRVYQLWLIPDTSPTNAALLATDAEGRVLATFTLPEGVTEPVPAAVTLEPAGGSSTPGGDVYLLGRP